MGINTAVATFDEMSSNRFLPDQWSPCSSGGLSFEEGLRVSPRRQDLGLLRAPRLLHHRHGEAGAVQGPLRLHHGARLPRRAARQELLHSGDFLSTNFIKSGPDLIKQMLLTHEIGPWA